jgi:protein-tyrosine phosphatase
LTAGSRDISLTSVLNVRDVGGIKTTSGQAVNTGRLIRGGKPDDITREDLDVLSKEVGVTTFLDLRGPAQFERAGNSEIVRRGLARVNVPLSKRTPVQGLELDFVVGRLEAGTMGDHRASYLRFVSSSDRFKLAMETIVDQGNGAVFVHCTAGKDRTGIMVAIILSAIGVHRDDVVADYAESSRATAELVRTFFGSSPRFRQIQSTLDPELLSSYTGAAPEVMQDVLTSVDENYGSPRQYLLDLNDGTQILEDLERKLLG